MYDFCLHSSLFITSDSSSSSVKQITISIRLMTSLTFKKQPQLGLKLFLEFLWHFQHCFCPLLLSAIISSTIHTLHYVLHIQQIAAAAAAPAPVPLPAPAGRPRRRPRRLLLLAAVFYCYGLWSAEQSAESVRRCCALAILVLGLPHMLRIFPIRGTFLR